MSYFEGHTIPGLKELLEKPKSEYADGIFGNVLARFEKLLDWYHDHIDDKKNSLQVTRRTDSQELTIAKRALEAMSRVISKLPADLREDMIIQMRQTYEAISLSEEASDSTSVSPFLLLLGPDAKEVKEDR